MSMTQTQFNEIIDTFFDALDAQLGVWVMHASSDKSNHSRAIAAYKEAIQEYELLLDTYASVNNPIFLAFRTQLNRLVYEVNFDGVRDGEITCNYGGNIFLNEQLKTEKNKLGEIDVTASARIRIDLLEQQLNENFRKNVAPLLYNGSYLQQRQRVSEGAFPHGVIVMEKEPEAKEHYVYSFHVKGNDNNHLLFPEEMETKKTSADVSRELPQVPTEDAADTLNASFVMAVCLSKEVLAFAGVFLVTMAAGLMVAGYMLSAGLVGGAAVVMLGVATQGFFSSSKPPVDELPINAPVATLH